MKTHVKLHALYKKLLTNFRELANFAYPESDKIEQLNYVPVTANKRNRYPVRKNTASN